VKYFVAEGSIKAHLLLNIFTPEQADFLHQNGGLTTERTGPGLLCQLGEIIMDGFKMGRQVIPLTNESALMHPSEYFYNVFSSNRQLSPSLDIRLDHLYNIRIMTIYESYYSKLYGTSGAYFSAVKNFFNAWYTSNPTMGLTSIVIEHK
jgi:hypothetical protein